MAKAQGALDYMLLVAGSVVVAAIVTVGIMSLGNTGSAVAEKNAINTEKQKQQTLYGFSIPGGINMSGLVSYWPFDEDSSSATFADKRGTMVLYRHGQATSVAGKRSNGVKIGETVSAGCSANSDDGVHSHQAASGNGGLPDAFANLPQGSYSIAWWQYETASGYTRLNPATNAAWSTCGNCSNWIRRERVQKQSSSGDQTPTFTFTQPSASAWHHFVYYFDKANNKHGIYIDGALAQEKTFSSDLDFGTLIWFSVGVYRPDCTDAMPGSIFDEVMVFSRVLDPPEIKKIYQDA